MTSDELKAEPSSDTFLEELHHLLWIDPFTKKRVYRDEGWNCRDHALIVAGVALMRGFRTLAIFGKAAFIQGPRDGKAPAAYEVNPHAWLSVDGVGTFDLSLRLASINGLPEWKDWGVKGLVGSKFSPSGKVVYMMSPDDRSYEMMVADATHRENQRTAAYLRKEFKRVGLDEIEAAFKWCNSPLTGRLKNLLKKPQHLYAKAIVHLIDVLDEHAKSLRELPQLKAWAAIAERSNDALTRLREAHANLPVANSTTI